MNKVSNLIYETYQSQFALLPADKQFHFVSRLASWDNNAWSRTQLRKMQGVDTLRNTYIPYLDECLGLSADDDQTINHMGARQPYFADYPWLYGLHRVLLQIKHWKYLYAFDARGYVNSHPQYTDWAAGINGLYADPKACQILSTYAVNTIYLWHRLILEDDEVLFDDWRLSDDRSMVPLTLDVYFVTHCIIAESLFYARAIPTERLRQYERMLGIIAQPIQDNIGLLTIDSLLECLVAYTLCGAVAPYHSQALERAEQAFDPTKGYLVDPSKPDKNGLAGAEHRNVLYLLATRQTTLR